MRGIPKIIRHQTHCSDYKNFPLLPCLFQLSLDKIKVLCIIWKYCGLLQWQFDGERFCRDLKHETRTMKGENTFHLYLLYLLHILRLGGAIWEVLMNTLHFVVNVFEDYLQCHDQAGKLSLGPQSMRTPHTAGLQGAKVSSSNIMNM